MKRIIFLITILFVSINFINAQSFHRVSQLTNVVTENWPHQPKPYKDFDWKKRALNFDEFIFDWNKKTEFPTIRLDTTHYNMSSNTIFIPAYYGDGRFNHDGWQDGLNIIADIVGTTLCGRRKDSVAINDSIYDYVNMLRTFKHQYKKIIAIYNYCSGCNYICVYYSMARCSVMFLAVCYFIFAHQTIITGLTL